MKWICSLIVFQYAILLLHARPEGSTAPASMELVTLQVEQQPASVPAIENVSPEKHVSTIIPVSIPVQTTKRAMSTPQARRNESTRKATKAPEPSTTSDSSETISKTTRYNDIKNRTNKQLTEIGEFEGQLINKSELQVTLLNNPSLLKALRQQEINRINQEYLANVYNYQHPYVTQLLNTPKRADRLDPSSVVTRIPVNSPVSLPSATAYYVLTPNQVGQMGTFQSGTNLLDIKNTYSPSFLNTDNYQVPRPPPLAVNSPATVNIPYHVFPSTAPPLLHTLTNITKLYSVFGASTPDPYTNFHAVKSKLPNRKIIKFSSTTRRTVEYFNKHGTGNGQRKTNHNKNHNQHNNNNNYRKNANKNNHKPSNKHNDRNNFKNNVKDHNVNHHRDPNRSEESQENHSAYENHYEYHHETNENGHYEKHHEDRYEKYHFANSHEKHHGNGHRRNHSEAHKHKQPSTTTKYSDFEENTTKHSLFHNENAHFISTTDNQMPLDIIIPMNTSDLGQQKNQSTIPTTTKECIVTTNLQNEQLETVCNTNDLKIVILQLDPANIENVTDLNEVEVSTPKLFRRPIAKPKNELDITTPSTRKAQNEPEEKAPDKKEKVKKTKNNKNDKDDDDDDEEEDESGDDENEDDEEEEDSDEDSDYDDADLDDYDYKDYGEKDGEESEELGFLGPFRDLFGLGQSRAPGDVQKRRRFRIRRRRWRNRRRRARQRRRKKRFKNRKNVKIRKLRRREKGDKKRKGGHGDDSGSSSKETINKYQTFILQSSSTTTTTPAPIKMVAVAQNSHHSSSKYPFHISKSTFYKFLALIPLFTVLKPFIFGVWTIVLAPLLVIAIGGIALGVVLYPFLAISRKQIYHASTNRAPKVVIHRHPSVPQRLNDELDAKQKSFVTTTPSADPIALTTLIAEKPTIYDIIEETEKNQTKFTSRAQSTPATMSPLLSLPLSSQMPMQIQRSGDSPKAIGHHIEMHHSGHPGIAEPLTWQQLESEMSMVDQNLKESSTPKDGISTWILLSGSDKQAQMLPTPATTTIAHVEKVDVKDDRQNYRFGEVLADKIMKPVKTRDSPDNKKPKPDKKNKISNSTLVTKTTHAPISTTSGILMASDFMSTEKNRRKTPLVNLNKFTKRKPTTTTTTTTTTPAPIVSNEKVDDAPTIAEEMEVTTPVSFIVLEPKIAGFDLPQDRSPATKKPQKAAAAATKAKRKPAKKNKVTAVTKTPNKNKVKPVTTTIYNYLSREVMPSVGILGAGILLTAGIASYIFGPLGALRRSYDDATDRQDNVDNIYSVNSEEYAGDGVDSGQHEEEIFSKFLAGMPSRDVPRYVKYFKPDGGNSHHPKGGPNYPYRHQVRLQQQPQPQPQPQAQASNIMPKYSPYMRYRTAPSPHYNSAQYNPQQPYPAYRNHQMSTQPAQQPQQPASPVYNPQYHEMQKQKSFANNMDNILKHQTTIYGKSSVVKANGIEEKSIATDIQAEAEEENLPHPEGQVAGQVSDVTENDAIEDVSAKIQRRTNTYVVGSSITDEQPGEAVVSASMTASVDGLPSQGIVEPVITVTASSHGPRRRRAAEIVTQKPLNETPSKATTSKPSTTTSAPVQNSRLYSTSDYSSLSSEFNILSDKIMSYDRDYANEENEKKIEKKIQTEFKSISNDFETLKKAVDGARAIEQFEKQAKIRAKNFELSVVLKTGISSLRQRIKYLNDLVEHPEDGRIVEKINRRDGSNTNLTVESNASSNSTTITDSTGPKGEEFENGFVGFLKLLQLKAQFGLNLLQNIRPSFERAFEEVFKRPYEKLNEQNN